MFDLSEPSGGGTVGMSRDAVATKSVSSPFVLLSLLV